MTSHVFSVTSKCKSICVIWTLGSSAIFFNSYYISFHPQDNICTWTWAREKGRVAIRDAAIAPPQYYGMHCTQWDCNSTVAMTLSAMLAWAVSHQALSMLHLPSTARSLHRGHCFPKATTATQGKLWPWDELMCSESEFWLTAPTQEDYYQTYIQKGLFQLWECCPGSQNCRPQQFWERQHSDSPLEEQILNNLME